MHRIPCKHARGKAEEVYVGRGFGTRKGSALANPYRLTAHTTAGHLLAVGKYRRWLWTQITNRNQHILEALRALRPESVLLCHCPTNMPCHADVIIKAWAWAHETGRIPAPKSSWPRPAPVTHRLITDRPNAQPKPEPKPLTPAQEAQKLERALAQKGVTVSASKPDVKHRVLKNLAPAYGLEYNILDDLAADLADLAVA